MMLKLSIEVEDSKLSYACDRYATSKRDYVPMLVFASVTGTFSSIKSLTAVLQSKRNHGISIDGKVAVIYPKWYLVARQKLPKHDAVHAVLVAKLDGLLFGDLDRELARYLRSDRIDWLLGLRQRK
jgi:hypothetical protein